MKKSLNIFLNIINWVNQKIAYFFAWLIFFLMLLILADVITRYLHFLKPLALSDEFGGYALVAITMGGLAYAWSEKSHVKVEFLLQIISPYKAWILTNITVFMAFLLSLVLTYSAWQHLQLAFLFKARSNTWMRTLLAYPQLAIIVGLVLLDIQILEDFLRRLFFGRNRPEQKEAASGIVKKLEEADYES